MGIEPRTEIFESANDEKYPNLETAVLSMARGSETSLTQYLGLLKIASKRLKKEAGSYLLSRNIKWTLISWRK
jgi:hypothetical protein